MKLALWLVRFLSGEDSYPLSCGEWLAERITAQSGRRQAIVRSARVRQGWR